jgi:hypothetical protein
MCFVVVLKSQGPSWEDSHHSQALVAAHQARATLAELETRQELLTPPKLSRDKEVRGSGGAVASCLNECRL